MKRKDLHNVVMLMIDEADDVCNRTPGTNVEMIGYLRMLSSKLSLMSSLEYEKWYANRSYAIKVKYAEMYKADKLMKEVNSGTNN